eukprot:Hpha_TRINITY_DN26323_c0_g1::TRINITY_DN26323_c0_g1_i1::g.9415::m.9415
MNRGYAVRRCLSRNGQVGWAVARLGHTAAMDDAVRTTKYKILHINDVYELSNLPALATLRDRLKPDALVLSGDFLSPSVLSSLDGGRSMIEALNALRVSHAALGNHEADMPLKVLEKRAAEFKGKMISANIGGLNPSLFHRFAEVGDLVFVGFLSSEKGVFRDGKFRGHSIGKPEEVLPTLSAELPDSVKAVIPVTHQSWEADLRLSAVKLPPRNGTDEGLPLAVVLGGHDHEVGIRRPEGGCQVIKSGTDGQEVGEIDVVVEEERESGRVRVSTWVKHHSTADVPGDEEMARLCAQLQMPVRQLQSQILIHHGSPLSSREARTRQTSLGGLICTACRDELGVEVCVINGGPIKGERDYPTGELSLLDVQQELPFPTKLVTVQMTGSQIREAVRYSRRGDPARGEPNPRGYLQHDVGVRCDADDLVVAIGGEPLEARREYSIALPRNLLAGFCGIEPLVSWAANNSDRLPHGETFQPALSVVLRRYARYLWKRVVGGRNFSDFDKNNDGLIDSQELQMALATHLGEEPSQALVDAVISAIDVNNDFSVTPAEFEQALSSV